MQLWPTFFTASRIITNWRAITLLKIRAFRRAAQSVVNHNEAIEDVAERGELEKIEVWAKAPRPLRANVSLQGKCACSKVSKNNIPKVVLTFARARTWPEAGRPALFQEAQIASIEDLKSAIENDRLKGIAGFGPGTIKNLQSGLERLAQVSRRLPLNDALNLAATLSAALANSPDIQRACSCRFRRRGCDTAGNVNLVVETENAEGAIELLIHSPLVLAVEEQNAEGTTVRARPGVAVHLKCATRDDFGARLFFETGSAAHIEQAQNALMNWVLNCALTRHFERGKRVWRQRRKRSFSTVRRAVYRTGIA